MKPLWARIVAVGILVSVTLLGVVPASAADFAGTWRVQHVVLGDEVVLVLHLRVFNQSAAGVVDAVVGVDDPVVPGFQDHPRFEGVAIAAGESLDLSGDMIVARSVYDTWQNGGRPTVHIEFIDALGTPVSHVLALVPEP